VENNILLREKIISFLQLDISKKNPTVEVLEENDKKDYLQQLIRYHGSEQDIITAYLLIPKEDGPFPGVLVHHQHNGERHIGKSEVAGIIGDPLQAFGPALAKKGFIVLAPDSICFEGRRKNCFTNETTEEESDWLQHYNEMCYRLLNGETLMKKVLDDAFIGLSVLENHPLVNKDQLGLLGHSYGGNTVLFQGAVDERVKFACSSGALCSYKNKIHNNTGIEMAEVIPGFINQFDVDDLLKCFIQRKLLIVSANDDKYSKDADIIIKQLLKEFNHLNIIHHIEHKRYDGGHPLTKERVEFIINYISSVYK